MTTFRQLNVDVDMHWRCRGHLHKRMRHAVDVKVNDYCDDYF